MRSDLCISCPAMVAPLHTPYNQISSSHAFCEVVATKQKAEKTQLRCEETGHRVLGYRVSSTPPPAFYCKSLLLGTLFPYPRAMSLAIGTIHHDAFSRACHFPIKIPHPRSSCHVRLSSCPVPFSAFSVVRDWTKYAKKIHKECGNPAMRVVETVCQYKRIKVVVRLNLLVLSGDLHQYRPATVGICYPLSPEYEE